MKGFARYFFWSFTLILICGLAMADQEFIPRHRADVGYFDLPADSRARAMGNVYSPISDGLSSIWGNPAGLTSLETNKPAVSLLLERRNIEGDVVTQDTTKTSPVLMEYGAGEIVNYNAYGIGSTFCDTFSLGFAYWHRMNYLDDSAADWDIKTEVWQLMAAYKLAETISLGYKLSYFDGKGDGDNRISIMAGGAPLSVFSDYDTEMRGVFHDLGLKMNLSDWQIGLIGGYGSGCWDTRGDWNPILAPFATYKLDDDVSLREWRLRLGVAREIIEKLLVGVDLQLSEYDADSHDDFGMGMKYSEDLRMWELGLGGEYSICDWLKLRAGYNWNSVRFDTEESGPTTPGVVMATASDKFERVAYSSYSSGFGLKFYGLVFDYSIIYADVDNGEVVHSAQVGYQF